MSDDRKEIVLFNAAGDEIKTVNSGQLITTLRDKDGNNIESNFTNSFGATFPTTLDTIPTTTQLVAGDAGGSIKVISREGNNLHVSPNIGGNGQFGLAARADVTANLADGISLTSFDGLHAAAANIIKGATDLNIARNAAGMAAGLGLGVTHFDQANNENFGFDKIVPILSDLPLQDARTAFNGVPTQSAMYGVRFLNTGIVDPVFVTNVITSGVTKTYNGLNTVGVVMLDNGSTLDVAQADADKNLKTITPQPSLSESFTSSTRSSIIDLTKSHGRSYGWYVDGLTVTGDGSVDLEHSPDGVVWYALDTLTVNNTKDYNNIPDTPSKFISANVTRNSGTIKVDIVVVT